MACSAGEGFRRLQAPANPPPLGGGGAQRLSASRRLAIEGLKGAGPPEIGPVASLDDQLGGHGLSTFGQ